MKIHKHLYISALLVSLVFVAFLSLSKYARSAFALRFAPLTAEDKDRISSLLHQAEKLAQRTRDGTVSYRKADYSSVGSPQMEGKLLQLRRAMDFFAYRFDRYPEDIRDFARISTIPTITSNQKRLYRSLADDCQVLVIQPDSYVLNCDHWTLPSQTQVKDLARSFDLETERFYSVEGHVLLYVPPPVTAKLTGTR